MATKDLFNDVAAVNTVVAANLSGNGDTTKGLAVDTAGYESVTCEATVGNSADTLSGSVYITVQMLESDTTADADFSAVATGDMIGGTQGAAGEIAVINAPTEDQVVVMAGYRGTKRYVRVDFVRTGNHATGTPCSANVLLSHARTTPAGACSAGAALT